ncbi:pentapeptide repeat-containing protein [Candidatus Nitrospira salsa]
MSGVLSEALVIVFVPTGYADICPRNIQRLVCSIVRRHRLRISLTLQCIVIVGVITASVGSVTFAVSCEVRQSSSTEPEIFRRHLIGTCTAEERERLAIHADSLFKVLKEGKQVDLRGVMIVGDLMLDQLPLQPLSPATLPSASAQQVVAERQIEEGRIIQRSVSVHNAVIQGNWATNLRQGLVIILGEFSVTGTRFEQSVDFSHTLFLQGLNFSNSEILYEGFFVRAHFEKPALFNKVLFGTHSRFHKAQFKHDAHFIESRFTGLAEFLEVIFEQGADFTKVQFQMGTGFSGAQFTGPAIFSESLFIREAFFRFSRFEQDADFQDATFQKISDFTDSSFAAHTNFNNVEFLIPPQFSGTIFEGTGQGANKQKNVSEIISVILVFLGFLCVLAWGLKKWRHSV